LFFSIHAPTRGATITPGFLFFLIYFSIHAPTRGATFHLILYTYLCQNFSIHAPTRGATYLIFYVLNMYLFSIHAPTRGATYNTCINQLHHVFQSTLLREERLVLKYPADNIESFQSTLLREERLFCFLQFFLSGGFQSTLLREERHGKECESCQPVIFSIHAPTRGATHN